MAAKRAKRQKNERLDRFSFFLSHVRRGGRPSDIGFPEFASLPDPALHAKPRGSRHVGSLESYLLRQGLPIPPSTKLWFHRPNWRKFSKAIPTTLVSSAAKLEDAVDAMRATGFGKIAPYRILRRVARDFKQLDCYVGHIHALRRVLEQLKEAELEPYAIDHVATVIQGLELAAPGVVDEFPDEDLTDEKKYARVGVRLVTPGRLMPVVVTPNAIERGRRGR